MSLIAPGAVEGRDCVTLGKLVGLKPRPRRRLHDDETRGGRTPITFGRVVPVRNSSPQRRGRGPAWAMQRSSVPAFQHSSVESHHVCLASSASSQSPAASRSRSNAVGGPELLGPPSPANRPNSRCRNATACRPGPCATAQIEADFALGRGWSLAVPHVVGSPSRILANADRYRADRSRGRYGD